MIDANNVSMEVTSLLPLLTRNNIFIGKKHSPKMGAVPGNGLYVVSTDVGVLGFNLDHRYHLPG